jgi:CHAT domain-containing protein/lipoprotein NlpI
LTSPTKSQTQSPTPLQTLARQIIEATSPDTRQTLLAANAHLNQSELAQSLIAEGRKRGNANPTQANTAFQLAVTIAQKAQDKESEATAYYNWGNQASKLGNPQLALEYFEQSLALRRKLPDQVELAKVLNNLAGMCQKLGLYQRALAAYQEALPLKQQALQADPTNTDLKTTLANSLTGIGRFHRILGDYSSALQYTARGLQIYREVNNQPSMVSALNEQGYIQFEMGALEKAIDSFQQALPYTDINSEPRAQLLNNLGQVYLQVGNLAEALEACQESLRLREALKQPEKIARTKWHLASIFLAQKNYNEALRLADAAADIARTNSAEDYWKARTIAGRAHWHQKQLEDARRCFAEALDTIEHLRTQADISPDIKQRYFENKVAPYLALVEVAVAQAQHAQALAYAERTKARVLLDLIANQKESEPLPANAINAAQPITLAEATLLVPDARTALLEFIVAEENVYLFVLHRTTASAPIELRVLPLAIRKPQLTALVANLQRALAGRQLNFTTSAATLYQQLLHPAQELLKSKKSLVIVPDSVLWELPFQALMPPSGRFLLEDYTVTYAPSLTVLRELIERKAAASKTSSTLLAFGNPTLSQELSGKLPALPDAEKQVRQLGTLFGTTISKIYLGAEASEQRFKAEAANYGILNLATHGIFDNQTPMASRLLLAASQQEDGALEAHEIMRLKLQAHLVVLSACETARGYIGPGEGLIGLTWAFLQTGVPTVVVSQWQVREDSTAQLMQSFYQRLKTPTTNVTRAEMLRQAALSVMKDTRYGHPFYWAGFVLVGNGS